MSEQTELTIHIDLDKMVVDDLEVLNQAEEGEFRPFLALLDRAAVVTGIEPILDEEGKVIKSAARQLPLRQIGEVVQAVNNAIMGMMDEGN